MTVFNVESPSISDLRSDRTSVKWANCHEDVIPMFIAEMDYSVDPRIQKALIDQIGQSDLGYSGELTELIDAFASFAKDRWDWAPDTEYFYGAPDVSFGVKAALRHMLPVGSRIAFTTPIYPSFFNYLVDLGFECVEIPLIGEGTEMRIDVDALAQAFAGDGMERVHGMILSNPHNPHGIVHTRDDLTLLAEAAAQHDAFIVSDEIHAPLTHKGSTFTPFAPLAAAAGAQSVTVTSASKGWNIAGTKCAFIYAPPEIAPDSLRDYIQASLGYSTSILGRTASIVAFRDCVSWLDAAIDRVTKNSVLLAELLDEHLPGARYTPPQASYLAWIDLRDAELGEVPAETLFDQARVHVSDGAGFGEAGKGFIRLNLGCSPELLREAVERMADAAAVTGAASGPAGN